MTKTTKFYHFTHINSDIIVIDEEWLFEKNILNGEAPEDTLFYVETATKRGYELDYQFPSSYAAYKDGKIMEVSRMDLDQQEVIRRHNAGESFYDILSSMK